MKNEGYCIVLSAIDDAHKAEQIGLAAVNKRLASAVNIVKDMQSIYRWKGNIENTGEMLMLFYTRTLLFDELSALIREMHHYELPMIISLGITEGLTEFLEWIASNTVSGLEDY